MQSVAVCLEKQEQAFSTPCSGETMKPTSMPSKSEQLSMEASMSALTLRLSDVAAPVASIKFPLIGEAREEETTWKVEPATAPDY